MKKPKLHPLISQLREIADSRGINRNQVAIRSGVSPSMIGRIFSGERTCTIETFAKIAAGIGLEVQIK
jgi:transcriptional regulator with XRE-family HTH domain